MNLNFLKSSEKEKLMKGLSEQFGIEELPYLLLETGKERIRAFSGSLTREEINELSSILHLEIVGTYLLRVENDLRLSFDATHILADKITKNVVEISEEQRNEWLRGADLEIKAPHGTVVVRCNEDFLGCGKSNGERIINHVPKERRIRK